MKSFYVTLLLLSISSQLVSLRVFDFLTVTDGRLIQQSIHLTATKWIDKAWCKILNCMSLFLLVSYLKM